MLLILATLLVLLPTIAGWGKAASLLLPMHERLSSYLLAGLVAVGTLTTIVAFFTSLSEWIEVFIVALGLAAFFWYRLYRMFWNFLKQNFKLFITYLVLVLFASSFFPFILDHFGYYVPSILWLQELGLVKGISNLDLVLGQMSTWHILQATFSHFSDPYLRINGLVLMIYIVYAIEKKNWVHFTIIPLLLLFVQSPSPDLPAIILGIILVNELLDRSQNLKSLFTLACFTVLIKPTLIWGPIAVFLYGILACKKKGFWWLPGSLLAVLFVLKNVWTFGYPIFPLTLFDLDVPWQVNTQIMKNSSAISIQKTYDMQFSLKQIQEFTLCEKIYHWFFLSGIKSVIHFIYFVTLLAMGIITAIKKSKLLFIVFVSIVIKTILILIVSAQYRFLLDAFFAMIVAIFYGIKQHKILIIVSLGISCLILSFLAKPQWIQKTIPSFRLGKFIKGFSFNQLVKPAEYSLKKYNLYQIGNLKFNLVDSYPFSFDTPLPAVSPGYVEEYKNAGIFPQLITDGNLKSGFIWKKITDDEKDNLERILKNWKENKDKP